MAALALLLVLAFTGLSGVLAFLLFRKPRTPLSQQSLASSELQYLTPAVDKPLQLGSLQDEATLDLSVIIPAFNETSRLPKMLDECTAFLAGRHETYELLIVDDGSRDGTAEAALRYGKAKGGSIAAALRVVRLARNKGKGAAVNHGMVHARGRTLLFVDADGASRFADLTLLEDAIKQIRQSTEYGVAVGSRAHMVQTAAVVQRSFVRNLLMRAFHFYLGLMGVTAVKDTQCGFKLFTREAARLIFPSARISGWIFDIELLLLAEMQAVPVKEVFISWQEIDGSKVQLLGASTEMALDLLSIRLNYLTGRWRVRRV